MLRGGLVKQVYELAGQGVSIRAIAQQLGISRNTVRTYLRAEEIPKQQARPPRASKLDPYKPYLEQRLGDGVQNCVVLLRELQDHGYGGSLTILKDYVHPRRRPRQPRATMRFEPEPGEQAQVDFGHFRYQALDGSYHHRFAFVLVLAWSRALYLEFIRRADVASFLRCHLNAFEYLGGLPQRCLYDNTKVVVLGRDGAGLPVWNTQFLDFSLRLGFSPQLCRPYRAQTKGRVESGIKYVRSNFWPGTRFTDDADLNRQALLWCDTVANTRIHGTTHERPCDRLLTERHVLHPVTDRRSLVPFLRETRLVGRDGFVSWERAAYGVPWQWAGKEVQVQASATTIELWSGEVRLAVHPRALHPGQRFTLPGQWEGLTSHTERPPKEPIAIQIPTVEVQQRPLALYESFAETRRV
jgi:transposase